MSATWRGTALLTLTVDVKTPPNQSLSSLSNQGNSVKCVRAVAQTASQSSSEEPSGESKKDSPDGLCEWQETNNST